MPEKQVKSKQRVADHGEVFTAEREVKAMCDLVAHKCEELTATFLEPACGEGNFLTEILARKLALIKTEKQKYSRTAYDWERYSLIALSTLYGVDIMVDNVTICRERIYKQWEKEYKQRCKKECNDQTKESAMYIIEHNILCGNALSMMCVDKNQQDTEIPIIFPEWSQVKPGVFRRRDFRFDVLLKANEEPTKKQRNLLDYELNEYLEEINGEFFPRPIAVYPPIHYRRIKEYG